jgi:cobalt-zinc-cadmium efflux system protein
MNRAFQVAVGLNTAFVVIEFFYGYWADSTALLADAGHNLSDVLSLVLSWGAASLTKLSPRGRYTYGYASSSIWVAWFNALLLLVACGAIAWEAIERLHAPVPVQTTTVMLVAGIGIVINAVSAWLFAQGSEHDLNLRSAYWHLLADAAVSLGVVVAGWMMAQTGWLWLDPVTSLIIVVVIVWGTWGLFKESMALALAAVPAHIQIDEVKQCLLSYPGVSQVHDLHVWGLSTTHTAMTAHLVMPEGHPGDAFVQTISLELNERFKIAHCTLQIEIEGIEHRCVLVDD